MELNYFKDKLFDLLNDSEGMGIADLNADEMNNLLTVKTEDGNLFEIICKQAAGKEAGFSAGDKNIVKCRQGQLIFKKDETERDSEE